MVTQPAPLRTDAAKSCHGASARAQPQMPIASSVAPAFVTAGTPKRWYSSGRFATTIDPTRKWAVTAVEIRASGQPCRS